MPEQQHDHGLRAGHDGTPDARTFRPVCVALGASLGRDEAVRFPITGFVYGSFSKRSVQFG